MMGIIKSRATEGLMSKGSHENNQSVRPEDWQDQLDYDQEYLDWVERQALEEDMRNANW